MYCTWAYNKNYQSLVDYTGEENESTETEDEEDTNTAAVKLLSKKECDEKILRRSQKYKTYTKDWLIKKVLFYSTDDAEIKIR